MATYGELKVQKLDKRRIKPRYRERRSRRRRAAQSHRREEGDTDEQDVSTKTRERWT